MSTSRKFSRHSLATVRSTGWTIDLHLSRSVIYQSSALLLSGFFLLAIAGAGYLVRYLGGEWGNELEAYFAINCLDDPGSSGPDDLLSHENEFAAADRGFTAVKHQREVGTGYFDAVTTTIEGSQSSTTALKGSTEDEQFFDKSSAAPLKAA